jgi:hypothetical protein
MQPCGRNWRPLDEHISAAPSGRMVMCGRRLTDVPIQGYPSGQARYRRSGITSHVDLRSAEYLHSSRGPQRSNWPMDPLLAGHCTGSKLCTNADTSSLKTPPVLSRTATHMCWPDRKGLADQHINWNGSLSHMCILMRSVASQAVSR